jgi:hypothetical protein
MSHVFLHSGDLGDLIYCLPVMLAACKGGRFGILLSQPKSHTVRKPWNPEWARNVIPLLEAQPYVEFARLHDGTESYTINCDGFRRRVFRQHVKGKLIPHYLCDELNVPYDCVNRQWLTVDHPVHIEARPIVVNRTRRYGNRMFPWRQLVDTFGHQMVFVGHPDEADEFISAFPSVAYCETADMLEVARLIRGSLLFVGNQSACYAVAEGLKAPAMLEEWPVDPNCHYPRDGVITNIAAIQSRLCQQNPVSTES